MLVRSAVRRYYRNWIWKLFHRHKKYRQRGIRFAGLGAKELSKFSRTFDQLPAISQVDCSI
jgi:hypothetical protein